MATRLGNAYIESVNYSLAHGATPSTCEIHFSRQANIVTDQPVSVYVGGSQWHGRVVDARDVRNGNVGLITTVNAIDYRDDLAGRTIFGQFNMIDPDDGTIYQINDYSDGEYGINNWQNQVAVQKHMSPRDIITILCQLSNFYPEFSATVEDILYDAGADWRSTIYNVFNIDWNTGVKIHAALQEICTRLGIQFTILMNVDRVLRFTVIGEQDYPDISWEGVFAVQSEVGVAANPEVDTGVWIVGDRQLNQLFEQPCSPSWNTIWNPLFLDTLYLGELCEDASLDFLTSTVQDFANVYGDDYLDANFVEAGKFFNDFTIKDYIRTVPFKVYRIDGMQNYLSDDEYYGRKKVRINPIVSPLVSDPGVQWEVKASSVHKKAKKVKNPVPISNKITDHQSGVRLIESTGHVIFDQIRFKYADSAIGKTYLNPDDVLVDSPVVTCVFLGPVFRQFFGVNLRVGTKHVPHLRVAKVCQAPDDDPDSIPEYIALGEMTAGQTANNVATGYLWRNRLVKSGKEQFVGFAGHVPTGEINRVSVAMNNSGVTEEVSYSNDEPSADYDPQVEQRRRIAQELLKRQQEHLRTTDARKHLHEQRLEAGGKLHIKSSDHADDFLVQAAVGAINKDGWALVNNTTPDTYVPGQPVFGQPDSTGQFASSPLSDVPDGSKTALGVVMYQSKANKHLPVVLHGPGQALVVGPVTTGDSLVYDAVNKALKKGAGGNCVAMKDSGSGSPTLIPVRIGAGSGGGTTDYAIATVAIISMSVPHGLPTIDGHAIIEGDTVLILTGSTPGVWVAHSGPWTGQINPKVVSVVFGTDFGKRSYIITDPVFKTYEGMGAEYL